MAQLVGTFFHSHGGTTDMPGELFRWLDGRGASVADPLRYA